MADTLTREQLENQLDIMKHQQRELVAEVNMNNGAIQMLQYLLSTFDNGAVDVTAPTDDKKEEENEDGISSSDSKEERSKGKGNADTNGQDRSEARQLADDVLSKTKNKAQAKS